jgi:hypothetical protein
VKIGVPNALLLVDIRFEKLRLFRLGSSGPIESVNTRELLPDGLLTD